MRSQLSRLVAIVGSMPIVQLQLVIRDDSERVAHETLQLLADELGEYFQSGAAATWVKVDYIPFEQYAENRETLRDDARPTLVHVLKYKIPDQERLAQEAKELACIVANALLRPERHTHIIYEPDGKGRVAFGGLLLR